MKAALKGILRYLCCLAALLAMVAVRHWLITVNATTAALCMLLVVLAAATRWGLAESIFTSIAGVLAFSVSARTNEIGIRMSLGADSGMIQRMVLSEGGVLLVVGLLVGVVGAIGTTRLIQELLFGVAPDDPVTVIGVC